MVINFYFINCSSSYRIDL
ncbi:hypothetical protein [Leptospira kirschneri]